MVNNMCTLKAGCYLINKKNKTVAVVYRNEYDDYSFPKGHLEEGETILECAIRETEEETKRTPKVLEKYKPFKEEYMTPTNEKCESYMFIALDNGISLNDSNEFHKTIWVPILDVENVLSYKGLIEVWKKAKKIILEEVLNDNETKEE